ncbi:MAG: hypothetical protein EAZ53_08640 [Bacteroidetes bacterium]|nr:MAG: hypothetical protein EAZ53_08640 [Bacteroidota bacterium]
MILESCIFDNTVFNYFLKIESLDFEIICKNIITKKVLVPSKIVAELEKFNSPFNNNQNLRVAKWIFDIPLNNFYHFCDSFDILVLEEVKKCLDLGESEAIAQSQQTGVIWFFSDDIKNKPFINKNFPNIKQHSFIFLIALSDILGLLPNYEIIINEVLAIRKYNKLKETKKKKLQKLIYEEYESAMKLMGVAKSEEILQKKSQIDEINKKLNPEIA